MLSFTVLLLVLVLGLVLVVLVLLVVDTVLVVVKLLKLFVSLYFELTPRKFGSIFLVCNSKESVEVFLKNFNFFVVKSTLGSNTLTIIFILLDLQVPCSGFARPVKVPLEVAEDIKEYFKFKKFLFNFFLKLTNKVITISGCELDRVGHGRKLGYIQSVFNIFKRSVAL